MEVKLAGVKNANAVEGEIVAEIVFPVWFLG